MSTEHADEETPPYLEQTATVLELGMVTAHVANRDAFRDADTLPAGMQATSLAGARLDAPQPIGHIEGTLGRYVVLGPIAGGAGSACAAYDRELDRKIALKFVRTGDGMASAEARARLLREARVLARLSHPNVAAIHDVGVLDGEVFLATELAAGTTLRSWLAHQPRSTAAIVDVFRQAGDGLAAAHAVGIVHRDFSCDSVVVGADRRVRVTDFGLASALRAPGAPLAVARSRAGDRPGPSRGPRAAGPEHRAPELQDGAPASPRSDVYAFCAAMHEALHGAPPSALGHRKRWLPRRLARAIARGLVRDPEARWPSMHALLHEIRRDPLYARPALAGVFAVVALGLAAVLARHDAPAAVAPCSEAGDAFAPAWSDARAAEVRAAFRAAQPRSGESAFGATSAALSAYRARWIEARNDACAATRIRGEASEQALELRMRCLDDRRRDAGQLAQLLTTADARAVERAGAAVASLPPISDCASERALASMPQPPAELGRRARTDAIAAVERRANALALTGRSDEALATLELALTEAAALRHPPLVAHLLVQRAAARTASRRDAWAARRDLHDAIALALAAHDDRTIAEAWTWLIRAEHDGAAGQGPDRASLERARLWIAYAKAAIERIGGDDALDARRLSYAAMVAHAEGRLDEQAALCGRARELAVKAFGADGPVLATTWQGTGAASCAAASAEPSGPRAP
ncbi:MAG TPA: serine/threonine-protein kinase [Kofleriaceae bacterium]|nr:serine/threonine-protein kinase [Kofleriaceae bacterium]